MSFFNNAKEQDDPGMSPQINIATPSYYQLGPGDELKVSVWGASENEYAFEITREGTIKIDRVGPVYVSGLTLLGAKKKIGTALSKIYSGISSSNESYQKVFFNVSLSKSRSIIINIVGSVERPGTYALSSMISVLNALYAAGGPTENGSFRAIQVLRNGKVYKSVDLYNYFVKGLFPSITLRDQDVILVPSYKNRVFINGEFNVLAWHHAYVAHRFTPVLGAQLERTSQENITRLTILPKIGIKGSYDRFIFDISFSNQ